MKNKIINNQNENTEDKSSCLCASLETKNEDYTHQYLGQELTRQIEIRVCRNCGEKQIPDNLLADMEAEMEAIVISLANERLKVPRSHKRSHRSPIIYQVPEGHTLIKYFDEVDLLFIRFGNQKSARTEDDGLEGLIFDFDKDKNLVSIEIIDFYDKFVTNEPDDQN